MQGKHTVKIKPSACFLCGTEGTWCVGEDDTLPSPGDTVTCLECGHLMVLDDDLSFRELTVEERDILSADIPMTSIQFGFDKQIKVAKELLFEQALSRTENGFPGQVFP